MSKSSELDKTVKLYLMECMEGYLPCEVPEDATIDERIQLTREHFECVMDYEIKRNGRVLALESWLRGLPLNIEYNWCDILELAVKWGSLPKDYTDKQAEKIQENYWHFIAIKLNQLFDGYHVPKEV